MLRKDLDRYFKEDPKTTQVTYIGDKPLVVSVFEKYESMGLTQIEDKVTTLGIFNVNIEGKDVLFSLPGNLVMNPTEIVHRTEPTESFIDFIFHKGDIFIEEQRMVVNTKLIFSIFKQFIADGMRYPSMNWSNVPRIFDFAYKADFNPNTVHKVMYSAMISELTRDPKNPGSLFRNGPMKGPALELGMKDISLTASKLTTKLTGSYLKHTMEVALITENKTSSDLENLLRR